jgi:BASS family bile acid:Na+ symporter
MTLLNLIPIALQTSIFLLVLSIGLTATLQDATLMLRSPGKLLRMIVAMDLVVPAFAVVVVLAFDLRRAVEIALVAIAISPVPPFLPIKAMKAGAQRTYTIGLLVAAAILSVAFIPLVMKLLDQLSPATLAMSPVTVAKQVLVSVLAPLAIGIAMRHFAPRIADRAARFMLMVAVVLLVAVLLPVLITASSAIVSLVGNGTVLAFAAIVAVGLAAGHLLGSPRSEERTMLALASGSRHPAVAVALAHANFPDDKLVMPAVLLYLIVCAVVTIPYVQWSRRRLGKLVARG